MHRVVEIDVIRQLVNLHPFDWLVRIFVTGPDRLKFGVIGPNRAVTVHTGVSRRHVRVPRLLHPVMAVPAVETQLLHVNGMRKGHRLGGLKPDPGVLGREIIVQTSRYHSPNEQKAKYYLAR